MHHLKPTATGVKRHSPSQHAAFITLGLAVQCNDKIQSLRSYLNHQVYFVQLLTAETMIIFTVKSSLYLGKCLNNYNSSGGTNSYM